MLFAFKFLHMKNLSRSKYFILPLIVTAFLYSCNNSGNASKEEESEATEDTQNCYKYISGSDTITMKVITKDDRISGELNYNFYEKDKNTGTFRGEMQGNRLSVIYTFMSEGVESTREVIFLKKGDTYTEGYFLDGNHSIVDFPGKVVLREVTCE